MELEEEGDPAAPLGMGVTPVDTQGLCFLCLIKVEPDWGEGNLPSSSSLTSLQHLWRYVKVDARKVVTAEEGDPRPPKLIKVSLCGACASLNGGLAELFRRLEEIELEITANLNYVLGKMSRADETGVGELFRKGAGGGGGSSLRIGEKLRKQTMEKCAHKLRSNLPQVQIVPEVTIKQEVQVGLQRTRKIPSIPEPDHVTSRSRKLDEGPTTSYIEPDDLFLGGEGDLSPGPVQDSGSDAEEDLLGAMDSSSDEEFMVKPPKKRKMTRTGTGTGPKLIRSSAPLKRKGKVAPIISNSSLDPGSGLRKCKHCSEEFSSAPEFVKHYKETHNNVKFKYECPLCGKEFAQKANYARHHQNFHMGIRYRCHKCNNTFTLRHNFKTHQRKHNCFGEWSKEVAPLSERPRRGRRPKPRPPPGPDSDEVDSDLDLDENAQVEGEGEGEGSGPGAIKIEGDPKVPKAKSSGDRICTSTTQKRLELGNNCTVDQETGLRKCNVCSKEFKSAPAFGNHYKEIHLKLRYQCKDCGEEFHQKGNYTRHHRNKHMGIKFKCKICGKLFSLKSNLRKHQRTDNCGVNESGRRADAEIIAPPSLKDIIVEVEPYAAPTEEERLSRENRQVVEATVGGVRVGKTKSRVIPAPLIFQEEVGTPEGSLNPQSGMHECNVCLRQFKHLKVFETHYKTVHLKRRYRCEPCGKVFSYHQVYTAHYQKVHIRVNFKCQYCDQGFTKKSKVKEHQKETGCGGTSGSEPIQQCEQCGKEFSKLVYLNRHVKAVHLNLRPHVCEKCGKRFTTSAHLKNHMLSIFHKMEDGMAEEGNLQCTYCGKRFWRQDYLTSHLRIHTGERPYQCEHCGKDFAAKSNYNKHQEMHRKPDSGRIVQPAPVPGPAHYSYF